MRDHKKKAFFKAFFLYYTTLAIFSTIFVYFYYGDEKHQFHQRILEKMQIHNNDLKNPNYTCEVIDYVPGMVFETLKINQVAAYSLHPIDATAHMKVLKISYPIALYQQDLATVQQKCLFILIALLFILGFIAWGFAYVTMKPITNAYDILEEFLKDITHDLNTPITAILLNVDLLKRKYDRESIDRIEASTKTIGNLYKNLEAYLHDTPKQREQIDVFALLQERISYYKKLYPEIDFIIDGKIEYISLNQEAFARIIDNLISNACRYHSYEEPYVKVSYAQNILYIEDNGIGIQNPHRAFERHYKEGDRGLGIGLNIVKKLCDDMGIKISFSSELDRGTTFKLILPSK